MKGQPIDRLEERAFSSMVDVLLKQVNKETEMCELLFPSLRYDELHFQNVSQLKE